MTSFFGGFEFYDLYEEVGGLEWISLDDFAPNHVSCLNGVPGEVTVIRHFLNNGEVATNPKLGGIDLSRRNSQLKRFWMRVRGWRKLDEKNSFRNRVVGSCFVIQVRINVCIASCLHILKHPPVMLIRRCIGKRDLPEPVVNRKQSLS
jgi:hypothetical protein